jgi:hypothetical protein
MTAKKTLENRIRGWFPQEPYRINTKVNSELGFERNKSPLTIPLGYNLSATKVAGAQAVFLTLILAFCISSEILSIVRGYTAFNFFNVLWLICGSIIGTILGLIITRNQLNLLSREYKLIQINKKEIILFIIPAVIYFTVTGFFFLALQNLLWWGNYAIFCWGAPLFLIRYFLFVAYERRENLCLVQSWWNSGIYVIPKPPCNNSNISETRTIKSC